MIRITRLANNKKRAISPIIAVILLIGLAVAASAAIFLVILPLLEPTSNLEMNDAYIIYDTDYTVATDNGKGYGKGTVSLSNAGTGKINIEEIQIFYATDYASTTWTEITAPQAWSIQEISTENPWILEPLTTNEDLTIRFELPVENDDSQVFYKIVVTPSKGTNLDTTKATTVSETDMNLEADRPAITFTGTLGTIRRTQQISPTTVSDNSRIKNVTYRVFDGTTPVLTKTIQQSLWRWQWNTYLGTAEGLVNGTDYTLSMTVYDYAGLSDTEEGIPFTIDNDYTAPSISGLWITSPYENNQTAEVGESISFTVEIIDGGTVVASASEVDSAYLYYRIEGSTDIYDIAPMYRDGTTNNWTANIPSGFVDSTALEEGIESYVSAEDLDGNSANTSDSMKLIAVYDHFEPDITHTPILEAGVADSYINITALIEDKDQVNDTTVKLFYRQTDDLGGITMSWKSLSPTISGNEYFWIIWGTEVTIHGIDYFFNATDRYSGHVAYEGTLASPHHINVPDPYAPMITHTQVTSATDEVALTLECEIFDNDPTFGAEGEETGDVRIYYRDWEGYITSFAWVAMNRIAGNSSIDSNGETPSSTIWSGTIPAAAVDYDPHPRLDYYIQAIDQSSNSGKSPSDVQFYSATVTPQGTPNIQYIASSIKVTGIIGEQIEFAIINTQGSATGAEITEMNITI